MQYQCSFHRRQFLCSAFASGLLSASPIHRKNSDLIQAIKPEIIWNNLDGKSSTWFHPRCCMIPSKEGQPRGLMTVQTIGGSDYFGAVHFSFSDDVGKTWSNPKPIPSLGRKPVDGHDGLQQGVCDVVPEYHATTESVLALGHVVFYRGGRFSSADQLPRYPVYAVLRKDGTWSDAKKLHWDDPRGGFIYSNNCGQRVNLDNGNVLLAFTFGPQSNFRSVAGVECSFDGEELKILKVGDPLTLQHKRGLLEPSLVKFDDDFYLTIRAEDNHGYVSRSRDGLSWEEKITWKWDDGTPLVMSTTQQHWLAHSNGLFLVYTRRDPANVNVTRWRAPLFVAKVDREKLCLIRESEKVVVPITGDGVNTPDEVPLMGNFHVNNASPSESWVTVGSWLPKSGARGAVHLAHIQWSAPNHRFDM